MTLDPEHERQHQIVADAKQRYDTLPKSVKGHQRVKEGNKAWWALTWHMRRSHREVLRARAPFLGRTYDEVEAWHDRLHEDHS